MMTTIFRSALAALAVWACSAGTASAQEAAALPPFPDALGISAPFAGFTGGRLLVGGGCNFPDCPAADGGKKAFYRRVCLLDAGNAQGRWHTIGALGENLAYGAAVETPRGLLCLGGQGYRGSTAAVCLLSYSAERGLQSESLPPLPVAMDNGGAALIGHTVYATGGNQTDGGRALYALDLDRPAAWRRLADYPGRQRLQPVVAAAGGRLYLIGGYAYDARRGRCHVADDALCYTPETDRWRSAGKLPKAADGTPLFAAGAAGVAVGGEVVVTGGVNAGVFKAAVEGKALADYLSQPEAWYRFNAEVYAFSPAARRWRRVATLPQTARAGAALCQSGGLLYLVGGELKPGIRTPQVTRLHLPLEKD